MVSRDGNTQLVCVSTFGHQETQTTYSKHKQHILIITVDTVFNLLLKFRNRCWLFLIVAIVFCSYLLYLFWDSFIVVCFGLAALGHRNYTTVSTHNTVFINRFHSLWGRHKNPLYIHLSCYVDHILLKETLVRLILLYICCVQGREVVTTLCIHYTCMDQAFQHF